MQTINDDVRESTRLAKTDSGKRITLTAQAYNALQNQLDLAMRVVYADRLREITDTPPLALYNGTICSIQVEDSKLFTFGKVFMPYLVVTDRFSISGYGTDHSVNVMTTFAKVSVEKRRSASSNWQFDDRFGVDSSLKLLLGELTVDAARKVANDQVDRVREYVVVENYLNNLSYHGSIQPFMTAVGEHVLIHHGVTGIPLSNDWTGICVDASNSKKHWFIGRTRGERSFTALAAREFKAAILESQLLIKSEAEELASDRS